jgi:trans-2,3-dihydro-3-hydroxyanthranilate isomerase
LKTYSIYQVDAFTTVPLGGNPCAVVFDCSDLDAEAFLAIAKEMNLSETAFVWRDPNGNFRARYFTPAEEIPLAGHPTIASVHALIDSGRVKITAGYMKISLELLEGPIDIEITSRTGETGQIVMSQRKPQFLATYHPAEILPVFGLQEGDLLPDAPIQTISTGTPQLMIPLKGLAALRKARLDTEKYTSLRNQSDFFSPHLFCLEGVEQGITFARHFGVPPDTPEDPFTGSATGGMAAYLWHYGYISKPTFTAEQGHWMSRPGLANVEVVGQPDDIVMVKVGGSAVTVLRGELTI